MRQSCTTVIMLAMACRALAAQTPGMERGVADLNRGSFNDAESEFRKAIALDPGWAQAYVYLSRALIGELPPNLHIFPDLQGVLPKADQAVRKAVELSPSNAEAWCVLGIVDYKSAITLKDPLQHARRLDQAKKDFNRALSIDPQLAEAHYQLGNMVMDEAMTPMLAARTMSGVKLGQPGPIADASIRRVMQKTYAAAIEAALSHTERALAIKPDWEPAVAQMGGLLLLRSMLRDSPADYAADLESSKTWQRKREAIAAKRAANPPLGVGFINGLPSVAPPLLQR